ncbi:hypothetical protein MJ904_12420 [Massilia sp. MB5]|uniref:hypothetical protein n=1 Tax=Massilia sp. MB5 TaxID=2919578 RepID=UPI001F110B3C|nr:hypothetical protein [Massilia sp. MB5]UMR32891.1 hypothetical protein MJ904_12420 [Massilia sp. MB5]
MEDDQAASGIGLDALQGSFQPRQQRRVLQRTGILGLAVDQHYARQLADRVQPLGFFIMLSYQFQHDRYPLYG